MTCCHLACKLPDLPLRRRWSTGVYCLEPVYLEVRPDQNEGYRPCSLETTFGYVYNLNLPVHLGFSATFPSLTKEGVDPLSFLMCRVNKHWRRRPPTLQYCTMRVIHLFPFSGTQCFRQFLGLCNLALDGSESMTRVHSQIPKP